MTLDSTLVFSRRSVVAMLALTAGTATLSVASAQSSLEGIPAGPLREHVAWFVDVLNDPDVQLTGADIAEHFSPAFLEQVPSDEVIGTIKQLRPALGTVAVGRIGSGTDETQAGVQLVGDTGVRLLLTLWLDPANELIGGMLIEPDTSASSSPEATVIASAVASPVAAAEPPAMDDVLPAFTDAESTLLQQGSTFTTALIAGDVATAEPLMTPDVLAAFGDGGATTFANTTQTNIVHMEFPEVAATFDGHVSDGGIQGFFYQLGPGTFELQAAESQSDTIPSGLWNGKINGVLDIEVVFSGTAETLAATLTIPSQNLKDHPLANVSFQTERPLGDKLQERALPLGQATNNNAYSALYEWGQTDLVINIAFNAEGQASGINLAAYPPLVPDPKADVIPDVEFRLPFEGTWLVIWGGDTEFQNYHAPVPSQRHAYDIVIWQDGATYAGDGTRNEQYYAWSQPVLAPASGTVVVSQDDQVDLAPNMISDPARAAEIDPNTHPAGNHVVIETGPDEYVLLAHFQSGTIAVAVGDTVATGDVLGLVGSSGNSSEPHIHIHLQNGVDLLDPATIGLPLPFVNYVANGELVPSGTPQQGDLIALAE